MTMSSLSKHVILKKNEERRLLGGHQWIFSNEIHRIVGTPSSGDIVEILRSDGKSLGVGFFNSQSLIAVRHLSPDIIDIDEAFFDHRIRTALRLREKLFPESTTYRVVHSESDFLPGVVIDRYDDTFSIQTFSAGMEQRKTMICDVLTTIFSPRCIVERNESSLRSLEGLPLQTSVLFGTPEPVTIQLNEVRFTVDVLNGQKSGFFLDQRENRRSIAPFVSNASVLDCFCNEGGFGLYAAAFGAKHVDSVDISEESIARARHNAELNTMTEIEFHQHDVFPFLEASVQSGKKWDVVILDPPSFTKSKKTVHTAIKGYKEINTNGLRCVSSPGIFISASCSHHIDQTAFVNIIKESGVKAERKVQLLRISGASPDHPVLPSMPETQYLTFALCSVE